MRLGVIDAPEVPIGVVHDHGHGDPLLRCSGRSRSQRTHREMGSLVHARGGVLKERDEGRNLVGATLKISRSHVA